MDGSTHKRVRFHVGKRELCYAHASSACKPERRPVANMHAKGIRGADPALVVLVGAFADAAGAFVVAFKVSFTQGPVATGRA